MNDTPKPNGDNGGRDAAGRFTRGNRGGTGNPYAKKTAELRAALMKAVTKRDIQQITERLVEDAKNGSIKAADLLLTRLLGAPIAADIMEQLNALETEIAELARIREDEHSRKN